MLIVDFHGGKDRGGFVKSTAFGGAKGFPVSLVLFVASGVYIDVLAELLIANL